MSDFPEALDAALSDHYSVRGDFRSPIGSSRGFQARVRALEKKYGTQKAAAAAAGIPANTWSKWKRGVQSPGPASLTKIAAAHLALLRAAKTAAKGTPGLIEIQAEIACMAVSPKSKGSNKYNSQAHRWFRADRLTGPQRHDVVTAWAAGRSPRAVADVLLNAVHTAYGSRFDFEGNNVSIHIS